MSLSSQLSGILDGSELGRDAGLGDLPIARPKSEEQARELLKLADRDGLPLVLLGLGSKLGWSLIAGEPSFGLSTSQLQGVIDFEPGDGVLSALAGTTLAELQRVAGAEGLEVTPNIPRPASATLGGVISSGQSGIDRDCRGAGRLHVLGIDSLQLGGTRTRSGGRLVKNVSGYDLHRLLSGSFGSLALVLEASLRLFPLPESYCVLTRSSEHQEELLVASNDLRDLGSTPHALLIENVTSADAWNLQLVLAGREAPLKVERQRAESCLGACEVVRGDPARKSVERLRDLQPDHDQLDVLHIGTRPSQLRKALGLLFDSLGPHGDASLVVYPWLATIDMGLPAGSLTAGRLQELRTALKPLGAQLTLRRRAPLDPEFSYGSCASASAKLSGRLRNVYDPAQLLCTRPPLGGWS